MSNSFIHHPSSYRDPSGFIFTKEDVLYRQVNLSFKEHFDLFINSGCYASLVAKGLLISHEEINENLTGDKYCYKIIKPEKTNFISYPYEWSFDMLKDAALLTLQLVRESIPYGLILKDATPYNIQWHKARLNDSVGQGSFIFIDTLSFEKYNEQMPWIAYRQFCESFLGPLLLMHYSKMPLQTLQLAYPDGIPLNIIKTLLPKRSRFSLHTYLHIHLNARLSSSAKDQTKKPVIFSKQKLLNLITSLDLLITKLKAPQQNTAWSDYYAEASLRNEYLENKKDIISRWIDKLPAIRSAADLGANDGEFSKLVAGKNIAVLAADFDAVCINNLYGQIKKTNEKNIQPLIIDLSNPSPANGVNNEERSSFISRTKVDLVMALALIHHLAIGKNIPFSGIANLFYQAGKHLIIEFVPKEDEKVQLMLSTRKDIYPHYTAEQFEKSFEEKFAIIEKKQIAGTTRILYLMTRHEK